MRLAEVALEQRAMLTSRVQSRLLAYEVMMRDLTQRYFNVRLPCIYIMSKLRIARL
jgi:hypothetical protein